MDPAAPPLVLLLHDPTDRRMATGDVFLAVGVDSPERAVRLAQAARATVVLLRAPSPLAPGVLSAAEETGVAVVLADLKASWSHMTVSAYGLVLEGRETESGRAPPG